MCNCGKKRTAYAQQSQARNVSTNAGVAATANAYTSFEYTGKTALSVTGKVTGIQYRFNSPGNRQNIDSRDVPYMAGVPVLRRV